MVAPVARPCLLDRLLIRLLRRPAISAEVAEVICREIRREADAMRTAEGRFAGAFTAFGEKSRRAGTASPSPAAPAPGAGRGDRPPPPSV